MNNTEEKIKKIIINHKDTTTVKVRFNDTDAMGIVHFKNYMVYFDDGFVSFMNSLKNKKMRIEEHVQKGIVMGVKHVDITYENTAKFGDYIIVKSNIDKIGIKSITFLHELFREADNSLLAVVRSTRIAFNLKQKKLLNIIDFFKEFLQDFN